MPQAAGDTCLRGLWPVSLKFWLFSPTHHWVIGSGDLTTHRPAVVEENTVFLGHREELRGHVSLTLGHSEIFM